MKPIVIDRLSFGILEPDPIIEWEYMAYYEEELPVWQQTNSPYAPKNWHVKKTRIKTASVYYPETWRGLELVE